MKILIKQSVKLLLSSPGGEAGGFFCLITSGMGQKLRDNMLHVPNKVWPCREGVGFEILLTQC